MFSAPAPGTVHGFCVSSRSDTAVLRIARSSRYDLAAWSCPADLMRSECQTLTCRSDLPEGGLLECRVQMATEKALVTLACGRRERPSPRSRVSIQVVAEGPKVRSPPWGSTISPASSSPSTLRL